MDLGLPVGPKSDKIGPPRAPFSRRDYFRGVVDADGSLGFAANGDPFLSVCTKSVELAEAVADFGGEIAGKSKRIGANKRDQAYNVMWWREQACAIVDELYRQAEIALLRKSVTARQVRTWRRTAGRRRSTPRRWTPAEDQIARDFTTAEAMEILGRSRDSVRIRRRALRAREVPASSDGPP